MSLWQVDYERTHNASVSFIRVLCIVLEWTWQYDVSKAHVFVYNGDKSAMTRVFFYIFVLRLLDTK